MEWEEANVNWEFEGRWGIKVEFGGFIGGFGKIFFTKGGIKREKEGFWGWEEREERRKNLYFFKIFKGVGKSSKLYGGNVFLGIMGGKKEKNRERIGFLG